MRIRIDLPSKMNSLEIYIFFKLNRFLLNACGAFKWWSRINVMNYPTIINVLGKLHKVWNFLNCFFISHMLLLQLTGRTFWAFLQLPNYWINKWFFYFQTAQLPMTESNPWVKWPQRTFMFNCHHLKFVSSFRFGL